MVKRRKIGTTYTKSPSDHVQTWLNENFSKLVFGVIWSIGYLIVLFVFTAVFKLLGTDIAGWWDPEEVSTINLYNSVYCLPLKILGVIGVFVYVFKDDLAKR